MRQQFRILKKEFEFMEKTKIYYRIQRRRKFIFLWDEWEYIGTNYDTIDRAKEELDFYVKSFEKKEEQVEQIIETE